jgi:hypothetical protein
MKKIIAKQKLEKGQVIPLVVVMLFAIIGMTALILDGGSVLSNRRTAQAAADAGALAGAKRACSGHSDGVVVGETYALNNGATTARATVNGTEVTVHTTVENPSYFAKIFGAETLQASAEATAGCYGVSGKAVMPMVVECRERALGQEEIPFPEYYGCQMQTLSWDILEPLLNGEVSSVVIDGVVYHLDGTNIVDNTGKPPGQIYVLGGNDKALTYDLGGGEVKTWRGDRGWVYLDVNKSAKDSILEGPQPNNNLNAHTWLTGDSGNMASNYGWMKSDFVGEVVLVPLYNYVCVNGPSDENHYCVTEAHASPWPSGEDDFSKMDKVNKTNYHIVAFQPFYITCISKNGKPMCPGLDLSIEIGEMKKDSVIEGFFLSDYPVSPDSSQGCDINLGNCTISLSN